MDLVAQRRIDVHQAIVLRNGLGETMPPFMVQRVDLRPRWGEKHTFVAAIDQAEASDDRLSRQMLQRGSSINQTSVEKDPGRGGKQRQSSFAAIKPETV